ncbi:hypothetical protein ACFU8U_00185, partial [Streptomyces albidoflavus]
PGSWVVCFLSLFFFLTFLLGGRSPSLPPPLARYEQVLMNRPAPSAPHRDADTPSADRIPAP